ncbi:Histone-lysine N-methyltransferase SETMAR-like [Oopsacas minuta]|uniref:Histone-lysine N-methyltransferase SETMAR-like n=1 Tax=Oopsacas minuta TaxID=111878 RepID=A0AAV7JIC9_9METZ|nr:Histone-lysine N-methyltransferase SETMAR-like [Oopsacas minuta]
MQDIFGDECPTKATIYRRIGRFDNGDVDLHDNPRPGCSTSSKTRSNIERIQTILEEDIRITLRGLEEGVVMGDETWFHYYEPESKTQSKQWKRRDEPVPIKAKAGKSAGKRMATVFWDREGIIYLDWLPEKTTINSDYYVDELKELRQAIKQER